MEQKGGIACISGILGVGRFSNNVFQISLLFAPEGTSQTPVPCFLISFALAKGLITHDHEGAFRGADPCPVHWSG